MEKDNPDIEEFYIIDKQLGEGNFGQVKLAIKRDTGEQFAVKIINKEKLESEELLSLQQEVEILTEIDHPNIVKLYEVFEDETNFYMILELMTGGELFERIVEQEHFSENKAAETIKVVIDALNYCHQMGIAHRDLKPENILYATKEPGSILKVSDFGLARFINNETMTTLCGTPGYIAPEILEEKGYNSAIDYWSVGVILYIMLCGFPPFYNEDPEKLLNIIKQGDFTFPSPAWDTISQEAKSFIKGLLTVDPQKRMTYDQLLQDPWLKGQGINFKHIPDINKKIQEFNARKQFKKINIVLKAVHSIRYLSQQKK